MIDSNAKAVSSMADIFSRCIEVGDCWEWQGAISSNGMPCVCLPTAYPKHPQSRSRRVTVSTLAWEASTGKSAKGKTVWRTCCNLLCVNPAHMRSGTREQMSAFLASKGAYKRTPSSIAAITNSKRKAGKLTIEKAREIRASEMTAVSLASMYGVHHSLITRIKSGQAWRETVAVSSVFALGAA